MCGKVASGKEKGAVLLLFVVNPVDIDTSGDKALEKSQRQGPHAGRNPGNLLQTGRQGGPIVRPLGRERHRLESYDAQCRPQNSFAFCQHSAAIFNIFTPRGTAFSFPSFKRPSFLPKDS